MPGRRFLPAALPLLTAAAALLACVACADDASQAPATASGGRPGATLGAAGKGAAPSRGGSGGAVTAPPSCEEASAEAEPGYHNGDRLPPFTLEGEGAGLTARLTTCASVPALLVVRVEAAFCGPCQLAVDNVAEAMAPVSGVPIELLTVVYADRDGAPATPRDAAAWRAAHPTLPGEVASSVDAAVRDAVAERHILPLWLVIDQRNGVLLDVLQNPPPGRAARALADAYEIISGVRVPTADPVIDKIDGRFRPDEWALVQRMSPVPKPPPSPSNAYADHPAAAALGSALFEDAALGGGAEVSCATCHRADRGFGDGLALPIGKGTGKLHTPAIALAAHERWSFWDGRADSLWSQALGPIENPLEMDGTRLGVVASVRDRHRAAYEAVFGPLSLSPLPARGRPGDASWEQLAESEKTEATRVFVNVGKALEAFERALPSPVTRFDRYVAGETTALDEGERDGLSHFLSAGCVTCHHGPTLSDGAFHSIRIRSHDLPADRGRIDGIAPLLASPFRADGPFSDDPSAGAGLSLLVSSEALLGQMKTPTLRNVARTGPWGHGGTFETLRGVVDHYAKPRPLPTPDGPIVGSEDETVGLFASSHAEHLERFLETLSNP